MLLILSMYLLFSNVRKLACGRVVGQVVDLKQICSLQLSSLLCASHFGSPSCLFDEPISGLCFLVLPYCFMIASDRFWVMC